MSEETKTVSESKNKAKLLAVHTLQGPFNQEVKVQYYEDGSIRFRVVDAGPMLLSESFLNGEKDVVLRVIEPESRAKNSQKAFFEKFIKLKLEKFNNLENKLMTIDLFPVSKIPQGLDLDKRDVAGFVAQIFHDHNIEEAQLDNYAADEIIYGKIIYSPDLAGERHAQKQVACPGRWDVIWEIESHDKIV